MDIIILLIIILSLCVLLFILFRNVCISYIFKNISNSIESEYDKILNNFLDDNIRFDSKKELVDNCLVLIEKHFYDKLLIHIIINKKSYLILSKLILNDLLILNYWEDKLILKAEETIKPNIIKKIPQDKQMPKINDNSVSLVDILGDFYK